MSVDIKRLTAHLSSQQQAAVRKVYRQRAESSTAAFVTCFFLGIFGAHRFYLKQWRQGFLHLLLVVAIALVIAGRFFLNLPDVAVAIVAGILLLLALLWVIVDLVSIDDEVARHNLTLAEQLIAQTLLADKTVEQQADAKLESMLHETAAAADAATNYGRMQVADVLAEAPSPNDTAVAAPIPAIGAVTGQYVATTITQISDDPNVTQHGSHQAAETEAAAQPHTESSVETDTVNDVPAEAALAGAALAPLVSEVVTQSHDVAGYSVTDGVETITTASIPEPPLADADAPAALDAGLLPTSEEAEAATWPNQLPVEPGQSAGGARWIVPDVTDRGEIGGEVKPVADIEAAGTLPLHVAFGDEVTPAGAETTADAAEGAALGVAALASAAPLFADAPAARNEEPPIVAVEAAAASDDASDEGLLFLVPEEAPVGPRSFETPAEAYIPPLVPVVSTPEAFAAPVDSAGEPDVAPVASELEPGVAAAGAPAFETVPEPVPVAYEPAPTPVATQESQVSQEHSYFGGGDLVGLAALSGLSGLTHLATSAADEAVSLSRAHRESLAAEAAAASMPATSETPAAPAYGAASVEQFAATEPEQPETLAEFATSSAPAMETPAMETVAEPEPVASAEPVAVASAEPVAEAAHQTAVASEPAAAAAAEPELVASEPQSEAVPVAVPVTAAAAAASAEALAHQQRKRIRVVRQLKVDGKVVEETAAEEYIEPDADPEPVKARLREQLRQQAEGRGNATGEANG